MVRETMNTEIRYCDIEWREADDRMGPGTLSGLLLPYETRALDRPEKFRAGSLTWPDRGIVLREQHNRQAPIIRFVPEERADGLHVSIPLPDTMRGRDAATSVRNGTLTGMSVEFVAKQETRESGLRVITDGLLTGAGLVDDASYPTEVQVRDKQTRRRLWL